jgi:hypothetical protein
MAQLYTYATLYRRYRDDYVITKSTQYARWTLPQLMANGGNTNGVSAKRVSAVERDFQEIGALLTNNLSAKLAGLLFPQSRPFFNIKPSVQMVRKAFEAGTDEAALRSALSKMELEACQQLFLNASYEQLVMALKHLIVTGNVLLYRDSKLQKTLAYGLESFVVRRDGRGHVSDCILKESMEFDDLAPSIQNILRIKYPDRYRTDNPGMNRIDLYTRIKRTQGEHAAFYTVSQEAADVPVGEPGTFPEHLCPWQAPTWSLVIGESYGRGLVEDYAGGFAKLSDESHAAALYGIAASKVVNIVQPGMGANVDDLNRAETGQYVAGMKDAITAYEAGDSGKMQQLAASIEGTFGRLARAFMYKANTRQAERVTAFELKQDAMEAETTLGGQYSSLSASIQVPLAHLTLTEINPGALEALVTRSIKLDISAGLPALGRAADVQNLAAAAQDIAAIVPILKQMSGKVDSDKVVSMIFASNSVDDARFNKTKDQLAQEAQANAQVAQGNAQIAQSTTTQDQANQLGQLQG